MCIYLNFFSCLLFNSDGNSDDSPSTSGTGWCSNMDSTEPPEIIFRPLHAVGAKLIKTALYSPLQLFQLFFSSLLLQTLMANSNAYGSMRQTVNGKPWKEITMKDMMSYLALVIYIGMVKHCRATGGSLRSTVCPCHLY